MAPLHWQMGKTHLECSRYMLDNEVNCDVTFKVGEDQEMIKAHKYTLSMRSAVFDRMFNGSFCEAESDPVIPDVTAEAFKMLLRYCYYDCLDMDDDVALDILYASTKYMMPLLEEAARKKLIEIVSSSNVWDIYKYSINVCDAVLGQGCHMIFQGNIKTMKDSLQHEAFRNIPHNVLVEFLHINDEVDNVQSLENNLPSILESKTDSSELNSSKVKDTAVYKNHYGISISEIELFEECNLWAAAECLRQEIDQTGANKRTVLGECLTLIRFPTMLPEYLMTIVFPTGILTQAEMVNLGLYIHQGPSSECSVDFPTSRRKLVVSAPELYGTFPEISTVYIESEVRVMLFTVWTPNPGRYSVTIRDERSEGSLIMKYSTKFHGNSTAEIQTRHKILHFIEIKPYVFEPCTKYSITAQRTESFDGPDQTPITKWVCIQDLFPFKEIKITSDLTEQGTIYAFTMALV